VASGKFIIRMSKEQHAVLQREARRLECSLNDLCLKRLTASIAIESLPEEIRSASSAASDLFSDRLLALAVFGSWAKGKTNDLSDIDLLIVLRQDLAITRQIYTDFENKCPVQGRIEPHFLHLPDTTRRISGLWAEVAMAGVIISDTSFALQRYLNFVKEQIVAGHLVKERLHGQNYWVHKGAA
jgi:hypothetical protein